MKQKDKHRVFLERMYGDCYEFDPGKDRLKCFYCGDVRECVDHMPPLSVVDRIGIQALRKRDVTLKTVPCCKACNHALGDRPVANFEERLAFLHEYYVRKAKGTAVWTEEDLNELQGHLRRMVENRNQSFIREIVMKLLGIRDSLCNLKMRN